MEMAIERQLNTVVGANLFAEQPPYLNSFFRFQLGSNTFDGYEFAMEAWKRVASVGATTVNTNTTHGDQQSLESLRLQKDAVKRELKLFDVHFTKFYGRQPSRLDKECLRKLYEFHKQLKAYIAAEEVKLERRHSHAALVESKTLLNSHNLADGPGHTAHSSPVPKHLPLEQLQAMDIKVLKAEKRALKIKLRRFEDEFIRLNGQKPQSYQEVGIIREDYSRYKFLKEQLQAVEQQQQGRGGTWQGRPSISP